MCRGGRALFVCLFQLENVFGKNKWYDFVAFKIPQCCVPAFASLGELRAVLALSTINGFL